MSEINPEKIPNARNFALKLISSLWGSIPRSGKNTILNSKNYFLYFSRNDDSYSKNERRGELEYPDKIRFVCFETERKSLKERKSLEKKKYIFLFLECRSFQVEKIWNQLWSRKPPQCIRQKRLHWMHWQSTG